MGGPAKGKQMPQLLNMDPALLKWYQLNQNRYKYFKWTPKTVQASLIYVVIVPAIIGYIGYKTDGKYDLRNKLRGDTIAEW